MKKLLTGSGLDRIPPRHHQRHDAVDTRYAEAFTEGPYPVE